MKWIISNSIVIGLSMFIITSYTKVDVLMLSAMQSDQVVGWYSAAYRLIAVTSLIPNVLVAAMFPRMSQSGIKLNDEISKLFTKGFKYLFFLVVPLIVGTTFLSNEIIVLLCGAKFENSGLVLKILCWAAGFNFFNIFLTGLFWASNNQNKMIIINVGGLVLNVILNYFLIPNFAHIGASFATVATEGFVLISCLIIALRGIVKITEFRFIVQSFVAASVMIFFLYYQFYQINLIINILLAATIYIVALFAIKGFTLRELMIDFKKGA